MGLCEGDTCGDGDTCETLRAIIERELSGRAYPRQPPSDINPFARVQAIQDFRWLMDPTNVEVLAQNGLTVSQWWQAIKYLAWQWGSHHGYSFPTGTNGRPTAISSSRFVDFTTLFPDQTLVTGAGPVWGCTCLIVVTERGAYTTHFWQNPSFTEPAAQFMHDVIDFLSYGNPNENYPSLAELVAPGGPFYQAAANGRFLYAAILTPAATVWDRTQMRWVNNPSGEPMYPIQIDFLRNTAAALLGMSPMDIRIQVHQYAYDNEIWIPRANRRPNLDRSIRLDNEPWRGMVFIQRERINDPVVYDPIVRVMIQDQVVFEHDLTDNSPPPSSTTHV